MCRDRVLLSAGAAAVALALLLPAAAGAYDFRLTPSVGVREEYNNNLFFSETGREEDWLLTVSPGVDASWKTERTEAGFGARLEWQDYQDNSDLDATDYSLSGRFSHRLSTEFLLSGTGSFRKESRPDRHFEEAGQVDFSENDRYDFGTALEWILSEKTTASASYSFEYLDYPEELGRDSRLHTAGLGITRSLPVSTGTTKARMNISYSRGDYENETTDNYILTVGLFRSLHELWSVQANAGVMHTRTEFEEGTGLESSSGTGFAGDASVNYTGERTTATFMFSHGLSPAFGYSGASLRTSATLGVERRFLYDISANFSAGYFRNSSDPGEYSTDEIDERSYRLRPGIRWKQSKYLTVDASYQYSRVDYKLTGGRAEQSVVYAGVTLSYPLFDE